MLDSLSPQRDLTAGEVFVTVSYSGDAVILSEKDSRIGCFIPEEGAPIWIDNFAISRSSRHPEEAHRFINFMISAEVAAATSNSLRSATPNDAAFPLIDRSIVDNPAIYPPPELLAKCRFIRPESKDLETKINRGLKRIYDQVRLSSQEISLSGSPPSEPATAIFMDR